MGGKVESTWLYGRQRLSYGGTPTSFKITLLSFSTYLMNFLQRGTNVHPIAAALLVRPLLLFFVGWLSHLKMSFYYHLISRAGGGILLVHYSVIILKPLLLFC